MPDEGNVKQPRLLRGGGEMWLLAIGRAKCTICNMSAKKDWRSPMNPSTKAMMWLLIVMSALIVILSLCVPTFTKLSEMDFVLAQLNKARQVTVLLGIYADEHSGIYPERLDALLDSEGANKPNVERMLRIDLEDGKPARSWIYHMGLGSNASDSEWVLISPPIVNSSISDWQRQKRRWKGGLQPPPAVPWRVVARKSRPVEWMPESQYRSLKQAEGWQIPESVVDD